MLKKQPEWKRRKLEELLDDDLIETPPSDDVSSTFIQALRELSFETLVAISAEKLDYRILVLECWRSMQFRINLGDDGGDALNTLGWLIVLGIKFPQYFNPSELQSLVFNILPDPISPQNPKEELYRRAFDYLHNFFGIVEMADSRMSDYIGYYSADAFAVRESGIFGCLVNTSELFFDLFRQEDTYRPS